MIRFDNERLCVRLRASRCWPVWRALKWFCPGLRAMSFPFLVIFIRFVYDLFVFIRSVVTRLPASQEWGSCDRELGKKWWHYTAS